MSSSEKRQSIQTIRLENISKRFGTFEAVSGVSLELAAGTIHGLLGENGAGKTTLMNILYGVERPGSGGIFINGQQVGLVGPGQALRLGISMIPQHSSLIPSMSVLDNVLMGLPGLSWLINVQFHTKRLNSLIEQLGLSIEPSSIVGSLPAGTKQLVEILRSLYHNADVLILDEPTSQLTFIEIEVLLRVLDELKRANKIVVFITHKLPEVMAVADSITVLRRGRIVLSQSKDQLDVNAIAKTMTGEASSAKEASISRKSGQPQLELRELQVSLPNGQLAVDRATLRIDSGVVFGLAGVIGNGQIELAEAIVGLRPTLKGSVFVDNVEVTNLSVFCRRTKHGIAYVPADRQNAGLLLNADIALNSVLRDYRSKLFAYLGIIQTKRILQFARELVVTFDISVRSLRQLVRYLSGGNQQRLIVARELACNPKILVIDNACQGLDLNAKAKIHEAIRRRASSGQATLYISSDVEDVLEVSDRVGVMYRGQIVGVLERESATLEKVGRLMAGLNEPAEKH